MQDAPSETGEIARRPAGASRDPDLKRRRLTEPRLVEPSEPRRRRLFHPVHGRFRRLERWLGTMLTAHLLPRVPGIARLYEWILRRHLKVSEARVRIAGLARALDGLRLLLITDVHTGPFVAPHRWDRILRRIATLDFDVLLYGGDVVTTRVEEFAAARDLFAELKAPLGTFAVLGNHDHLTGDPDRLAREIEAAGIRLLRNRSVILERDGARIALAGIDDFLFGHPDLDAALADVPSATPIVLLSHNPDVFFQAVSRGVSLVLSGHTHAGQIRIPGLPVIVRMSQYRLDEGRYRAGKTELVVSAGLGAAGLPLRVFCPPEVVLIELTPGGGPA